MSGATPARAIGLLLLLGAIWFYRRFLSGRGPLRRVGCTFRASESCSTFGLRAVHEARTPGEALRRIRARLRFCSAANLYVDADRTLLWGPAYDEPPEALDAALAARGELPSTRALVLDGHAAFAHWTGDHAGAHACRARAGALSPAAPRPRPVVRRAGGLSRVLACRLALRLAALVLLFTPLALLVPAQVVAAGAAFALALAADATLDAHRETAARFAAQRRSEHRLPHPAGQKGGLDA